MSVRQWQRICSFQSQLNIFIYIIYCLSSWSQTWRLFGQAWGMITNSSIFLHSLLILQCLDLIWGLSLWLLLWEIRYWYCMKTLILGGEKLGNDESTQGWETKSKMKHSRVSRGIQVVLAMYGREKRERLSVKIENWKILIIENIFKKLKIEMARIWKEMESHFSCNYICFRLTFIRQPQVYQHFRSRAQPRAKLQMFSVLVGGLGLRLMNFICIVAIF